MVTQGRRAPASSQLDAASTALTTAATRLDARRRSKNTGQKIRTTAAVLRERLGNCVDLSVTYAACLEAAGLQARSCGSSKATRSRGFFLGEDRLPETVSLDPHR